MLHVTKARLVPERVTAMCENLYAWEKIRKIESDLEAARPRYSVTGAGFAGLARRARRLAIAAVSRLAAALRRNRRTGANAEPAPAGQRVLGALVEGRSPR